MRIATSFVVAPTRLVRPLAVLTWGLAGMAAAATLWLAQAASGVREEIPALRERLAQLEQRQREIAMPERLPMAALQDLKQRVTALNMLAGNQGRPVTTLLADLEQWLPDTVWLVSLHDRTKSGDVLLVAEAESVEPLTTLLLRLERQPRFAEVLLVKQTPRGASRRAVQFEIRLKERS